MSLFESVPNFSEGRDPERVERIVAAGRDVDGVAILDVERNADHHRSVVTIAGPGPAVSESVFRMMRAAVEIIDLRSHRGEHPRMGAVDVVPFVPLGDASMDDAVGFATSLADRVWSELHLPVYLYGAAARRPERADLAWLRRGQFEGIRESIATDPTRAPDFGTPEVHPTAGIVAIGARPVLIAYNAYLTTPDVTIAKKVARAVRGRDGGLAEVKALGFDIRERQRAQVSMNLTDYRKTPIHRALELVRAEAARFGVSIEESEVVGLVPEDALLDASEFYLQLNRFERANVLERRVRAAALTPPDKGTPGATPGVLADQPFGKLAEQIATRTPTPGGGSAAAAAGALGSALAEMVLAYSNRGDGTWAELGDVARECTEGRRAFLHAIDDDAQAYDGVRAARQSRRSNPNDPKLQETWSGAVRRAAEVPLATARLARRLETRLEAVRSRLKPSLGSDLVTALALLRAAREGAQANVAINLDDLREAGIPVAELEADLERLATLP